MIKKGSHASNWAAVVYKGPDGTIRTPGLWLTPHKSALHARFTGNLEVNAGLEIPGELLLQKWYHIAYTLPDPKKRLDIYIDGEWTGFFGIQEVKRQNIIFNDSPLYIGKGTFTNRFSGEICNFRYFNWHLSANEVSDDFGYRSIGNLI
ncbi:concanavalin A-like lectin/glucanase [Gigaspora margarita]|uniref:Concanavalin A-like lectin/glucanase n=1 Tax=Gigaspora margarita TaxID=4874 RepID=A0A8H4EQU8_GIGMA|nr:concanavalin A-like lectin/glucanase [Gigaspora margarita]